MKNLSRYTQVALAVAAVCASSVVIANGGGGGYGHSGGDVEYSSSTDVSIDKKVVMKRKVEIEGQVDVDGDINISGSSAALVSVSQTTKYNWVDNDIVNNTAAAGDNALRDASGNIGLNITAGDNNQQDNSASLSAVDADFVFADAEIVSHQKSSMNATTNFATVNSAGMTGNVLQNASGNIAANISAGDSNLQANSLAAAVNSGSMAEADISSIQSGMGNLTTNTGAFLTIQEQTEVTLTGTMSGNSEGGGSGVYQGTAGGTTEGQSDQIGDLYVDIWANDSNDLDDGGEAHPTDDGFISHADFDSEAQGAQDLNGDGGALAFGEDGTYSGSESGASQFTEVGTLSLSGTFSGMVNNTETVFLPFENNANLSGNALRGASGNIGVNIASGTNNLQGNHLAIAASNGVGTPTPPPAGGEL